MKTKDIVSFLRYLDIKNLWVFNAPMAGFFLNESGKKLHQSLQRYVRCGLLRHLVADVYANAFLVSLPTSNLSALLPYVRPGHFSYISFESALSDYGAISQIPFILTCATTGESGVVETSIGRFDFTKVPHDNFLNSVYFDRELGMYYAEPALAYRDLQAAKRNLGLVDMEELAVIIDEFEKEKKKRIRHG